MSQSTGIVHAPRVTTSHPLRAALSWGAYLALSTLVMVAALFQMSRVGVAQATQFSAKTLAAAPVNGAPAGAAPSVVASAAFLFDANTGLALYSKNADAELPQASCTKVMTALVAVEHGKLDQVITVGADAHALVGPDSSYMGLGVGEKLTLRDLLYGLMLPSGNDAAVAIADGVAGSVPAFVALMNQRAQQLGLTHTHFINPHGLDAPGHYTSARDLAALAAVAMRNPTIEKITSTLTYDIPVTSAHKAYHLMTGDDLLAGARSPYPGAIGVKPGFTGPAGFTMAFAAVRFGHLIVGAVMHDPSWQVRIVDMRTLLDWGFEQDGVSPAPSSTPWSNPDPSLYK
ncbi:MAG TPA: D-alanyl-D-alanine carboxypeptidase family protein [Ktedonobacterales bacterium]|nr:D-alanyl-D-alanine carboxypeptidase family protein [Ktedonobacterales bacterium]